MGGVVAQVQPPCGVGDQSGVCGGEGRGRPRLMAGRKVGESLRLGPGNRSGWQAEGVIVRGRQWQKRSLEVTMYLGIFLQF